MMTVYHLDAETFAKLEGVLTALYGHGEVLTADARRDLAHRLGLIRDEIASCMEQVDETPTTPTYAWRLTGAGAWVYVNPEGADVGNVYRAEGFHGTQWIGSPWGREIRNFKTEDEAKAHVEKAFR